MEPENRLMESYPQLVEVAGGLVEKRGQLMEAWFSKINDLAQVQGGIHQSAGDYPTTFCRKRHKPQKNPARRRGGNGRFHQSAARVGWIGPLFMAAVAGC